MMALAGFKLLFLCSMRVKLLTGAARILRNNQHAVLF